MTVSTEERQGKLEAAKKVADERVAELEKQLAAARKEAETKALQLQEEKLAGKESSAEIEDAEEQAVENNKKETAKKTAAKEKSSPKKDEGFEQSKKKKNAEKAQLEAYAISQKNKKSGKVKVGEGNKVKHSVCEVFVYLVDDNELQLKVLQEKFKNTRSFKRTEAFASGEECLAYIKKHKYPARSIILVIADFHLDDSDDEDVMNGIDLLGELKQYDPTIEVIMLSGSNDDHVVRAAAKYGATNFIQKGPDSFKKTLNSMLWAIREKDSIRKTAESKNSIKNLIVGMIVIFFVIFVLGYFVFPDVFRFF